LSATTNYSLFYFITVDDAAINAKYSTIEYINVVTSGYLKVDLFDFIGLQKLSILCMVILLVFIE